MALSKTGRFLSKAEILGVGVFSPLPIFLLGDKIFLVVPVTKIGVSTPATCKNLPSFSRLFLCGRLWEQKKTNKHKTHKHFSDGPCRTIVPGTNPHSSQGQTGQNGDFTVEFNRERPVCPRDGSHFVPGRVPFVPGTVPVCPGHCFFSCPSL